MPGKAYYKNREILKINEKYVEGYGWITEEQYKKIMYNPENPQTQLWTKVKFYNIQYKKPNGQIGQMDIEYSDFWTNRTFVLEKEDVWK